jgi:protease-4
MLSTSTKFSDPERAKLRKYMGDVYEIFKAHVVAGRGDKLTKPIEQIAGGRVFTGTQALELGLIDKIGGFDDAVKFAANEAGLGDYEIRVLPEPPGFFELLSGGRDDEYAWSKLADSSLIDTPVIRAGLTALAGVDPLRVRAVLRALQRVELVHKEGVVTMMPTELLIR